MSEPGPRIGLFFDLQMIQMGNSSTICAAMQSHGSRIVSYWGHFVGQSH